MVANKNNKNMKNHCDEIKIKYPDLIWCSSDKISDPERCRNIGVATAKTEFLLFLDFLM